MRLFFVFVASLDFVINFRVSLKDVHCGSNEVIFSLQYYSSLTKISVKREVSEEKRKFNSNWEERYFFANSNGKPECLVKMQVISIPKKILLKRHYSTKHEKSYGKFDGHSREATLK